MLRIVRPVVNVDGLFSIFYLLSRRSRQRERLHATGVSICSSVCLSVCLLPTCKNVIFSKPKQFRAMVSIDYLYEVVHVLSHYPLLKP